MKKELHGCTLTAIAHEDVLEDGGPAALNLEVEFQPRRGRPRSVPGQVRRRTTREEGRKPWDQRYRRAWEEDPRLAGWLAAVPGNAYRAWCLYCQHSIIARYQALIAHQQRSKHVNNVQAGVSAEPPPTAGASSSSGAGSGGRSRPTDVSYDDAERVHYSIGLGDVSVGFVGGGWLAQAIGQGLLDHGVAQPGQLHVLHAEPEEAATWRGWGCQLAQTPAQLVAAGHLLLVTLPPQRAAAALRLLAAAPPPDEERCLVSAVPGLSLAALRRLLAGWPAGRLRLVRCAAGLPLAVGAGCCVYCVAAPLSERWLLALETAFGALGRCCRLQDERSLDALSGLVDSGAAFTAAFVDALAAGAAGLGVPWRLARQLAAQTAAGAAQLLCAGELSPAELLERASEPGGHTAAGVRRLQRDGFQSSVAAAVEAAGERAHQIGRRCEQEDRDAGQAGGPGEACALEATDV